MTGGSGSQCLWKVLNTLIDILKAISQKRVCLITRCPIQFEFACLQSNVASSLQQNVHFLIFSICFSLSPAVLSWAILSHIWSIFLSKFAKSYPTASPTTFYEPASPNGNVWHPNGQSPAFQRRDGRAFERPNA